MTNPLRLPAAELLLRGAVAFSFLYPPVAALSDPYAWTGYFPGFVTALASGNDLMLLHAFGVVEVLIAIWILFGRRPFIPAVIATVVLFAIVLLNLAQFPILFRDVSIALAALALAYRHHPKA